MTIVGAIVALALIVIGIGAPFALDRHPVDLIFTVLFGGVGFSLGIASVGFDTFMAYCAGLGGFVLALGVIYLNLWVKPKLRIGGTRPNYR